MDFKEIARTVVESAEFEDYFVIRNPGEFHAWWKTIPVEVVGDPIDYNWSEVETADHFDTYEEAAEFRDNHKPAHNGVVCKVAVKTFMSVKVAEEESKNG